MKRVFVLLQVVAVLFVLAACGQKETATVSETEAVKESSLKGASSSDQAASLAEIAKTQEELGEKAVWNEERQEFYNSDYVTWNEETKEYEVVVKENPVVVSDSALTLEAWAEQFSDDDIVVGALKNFEKAYDELVDEKPELLIYSSYLPGMEEVLYTITDLGQSKVPMLVSYITDDNPYARVLATAVGEMTGYRYDLWYDAKTWVAEYEEWNK